MNASSVPSLDIVGVGFSSLDVLVRLKDMPTWERPGRASALALEGGGPVGTACVAAARLGARVGYVGTAGSDLLAELKLRSFHEDGVDLSRLVRREGPEGHVVIVYVHEETGERVFSGAGRWDPAARLAAGDLDRDYITAARYLHLDGIECEAALQAARWMHEAGKKVCLDAAKTDGRPLAPQMVELVKVAAIKCAKLGGRPGIPRFQEVAAFLHERGLGLPGAQ